MKLTDLFKFKLFERKDTADLAVVNENFQTAESEIDKRLLKTAVQNTNTVTEAGYALDARQANPNVKGSLAELIAGVSKPSATLVLGGGHSIGIPLAVAARRSFIVPTATMTVHPVRHSGMVLGVPQTLRYFEQMQERIVSFVAHHSGITARRFTQLMHNTGELVMDMGTVLDGHQAVEEGLIDQLGGLEDALAYLYKEIEQ